MGIAKEFYPNFPKLARKILCAIHTLHKDEKRAGLGTKKGLQLTHRASFFGEKSGNLFHSVSFDVAETSVPEFSGILGVRLQLLHPQLLHEWCWISTRVCVVTTPLHNLMNWIYTHSRVDEALLLEAAGSTVCFLRTISCYSHPPNGVLNMHLIGLQLRVIKPR